MRKEYERLESRIAQVKQELTTLPEGKLICAQGNKCYKWYVSDGHRKTYLPKKERRLAEQLAYKKYLTLLLEELEHEKIAISFYLRHHSSEKNKSASLLKEQAGYQELLLPHFKVASEELSDWMQAPL